MGSMHERTSLSPHWASNESPSAFAGEGSREQVGYGQLEIGFRDRGGGVGLEDSVLGVAPFGRGAGEDLRGKERMPGARSRTVPPAPSWG